MYRKCFIPKCDSTRNNVKLHKFPNIKERQVLWIKSIEGVIQPRKLDHSSGKFEKYFVCHKHFEKRFTTKRGRILAKAYPTLFTAEELSTGLPSKQIEETEHVVIDHQYAKKQHFDHTYCMSESSKALSGASSSIAEYVKTFRSDTGETLENDPDDTSDNDPVETLENYPVVTSENDPVETSENDTFGILGSYTVETLDDDTFGILEPHSFESLENDTFEILGSHTVGTLERETVVVNQKAVVTKKVTSPYNHGSTKVLAPVPLNTKPVPESRKKKDLNNKNDSRKIKRLMMRLKETKSTLAALKKKAKLIDNLESPVLKDMVLSALHNQKVRKSSSRRWGTESKVAALIIYKRWPEAYKYIRHIIPLPTKQTLNKTMNRIQSEPDPLARPEELSGENYAVSFK